MFSLVLIMFTPRIQDTISSKTTLTANTSQLSRDQSGSASHITPKQTRHTTSTMKRSSTGRSLKFSLVHTSSCTRKAPSTFGWWRTGWTLSVTWEVSSTSSLISCSSYSGTEDVLCTPVLPAEALCNCLSPLNDYELSFRSYPSSPLVLIIGSAFNLAC